MRKIKTWKGGDKMRMLMRNKERIDYVDHGGLTKEQMDQLSPILDEISYRREHGLAKYYPAEEVHKELLQIIEEAERKSE